MSPVGALFRASLRQNFGLSVAWHRLVVLRKDLWLAPFALLAGASLVPLMIGYVAGVRGLYRFLQPMGQQGVILTLAVLVGQLVVLLFGLYYVLAAFYFSRDLEFLIALPVKPWQVMASKLGVVVVNEYLTTAVFVLPAIVAFGVLDRRAYTLSF